MLVNILLQDGRTNYIEGVFREYCPSLARTFRP